MKLTTVEVDPLLNKAKANKFALWRTFNYVGQQALKAVLRGDISLEKAHVHLAALRKMKLEDASFQYVHTHLKQNGLLRDEDDIDFTYYGQSQ